MRSEGPVRVVCFDWGGVIVRICRSWAEGFERAGVAYRGDVVERAAGAWRAIGEAYQVGLMHDAEFTQRMSEACGGVFGPSDVEAMHRAWLVEEYAGMARVVDRLHGIEGVSTGLLSNTNALHWSEQLRPDEGGSGRFGVARRLEYRVGSHLVGLAKPGTEIYRAFEAASGAAGGEILFFDDLEANVASARALGWRAERIDPDGDVAQQVLGHLDRHGVVAARD